MGKKDKYDTMNTDKERQDKETAAKDAADKKKEYDDRRTTYDEKRNAYFTAKNGKEAKQKEIDDLTTKIDAMADGDEKEALKGKRTTATGERDAFDGQLTANGN